MRIESSDLHPTGSGRVSNPSRLTRRELLRATAGVAGAGWAFSAWGGVSFADERPHGEPRPIPGGIEIEGRTFHVFPPSEPGAGREPSTITDFIGSVGIAEISGEGTSGDGSRLVYNVDVRFLSGHFVDMQGHVRRDAFGFL